MLIEKIKAHGHRNVSARHKTTFEVTREEHLTPRGDCIIAVDADRSFPGIPEGFKEALRRDDAVLEITITCGGLTERVIAHGNSALTLTHSTDLVVRKSSFICDRTLAVKADKAAADLGRELVKKLAEGLPVAVELRILD